MAEEVWSRSWSNAVFSTRERDRRWAKVRALMARDGIDVLAVLPCSNSHNRGAADALYLTQLGEGADETIVVFPMEGEPTAWLSRGGVWPSSNWFTDIRAASRGTGGRTIVDRLKEMGFQRGTIGIPGLTGGVLAHSREAEGEANWQSVETIKQAFPEAKVVSATDLLGNARYQKSEEEIEFLRKGTLLGEKILQTMLDTARPGVPERTVFARMWETNAREGGSVNPMFGWSSGPFPNLYHRVEQPSFRSFQPGDMLSVEIDGRWGGYISQIDPCFYFGHAPQDLKDVQQLIFDAFNRMMSALRAGMTVAELAEVGMATGMAGRAQTQMSMHGRGTGDDGPLIVGRSSPELGRVEIKENTVMMLRSSGSLDGVGYGRWAETVVIRKNRAERLGTRPQVLYEIN
jgi:Xaa-Pro aminopeptidase